MRIISKKTMAKFWENEPFAEQPLKDWYKIVSKSEWLNHNDLKQQFGTASIINSQRVVFNIHGNKYRLIVDVIYKINQIHVIWIGTHKSYDNIDVKTVQYNRID